MMNGGYIVDILCVLWLTEPATMQRGPETSTTLRDRASIFGDYALTCRCERVLSGSI